MTAYRSRIQSAAMDVVYGSPVQATAPPAAMRFVGEVANLYHRNARLFLKILLPASCFGWLVVTMAFQKASEIVRYVPRGIEARNYLKELWEAAGFRVLGVSIEWLLYCFAFAAMSVAVAKLVTGEDVIVEDGFAPVRQNMKKLLTVSAALGALVSLSLACAVALFVCAISLTARRHAAIGGGQWAVYLCIWSLLLWAVARFGLAIPIAFIANESSRNALTMSYRLTRGCSRILGLLMLESIGGSYLAYLLPHWIWRLAYMHGLASQSMYWLAFAVGILTGVLIQPHMFVGFALLYLRRKGANEALIS